MPVAVETVDLTKKYNGNIFITKTEIDKGTDFVIELVIIE